MQTYRSFLQGEVKVGVCADPHILPSVRGHPLGPLRWLPLGDRSIASHHDRTRDMHTHTPLSPTGLLQKLWSRRSRDKPLGGWSSTLHSKVSPITAHSRRSILQRKLRLERQLGQGRTPSLRLGNSRDTTSQAGLGAKCLLCKIKSI